MKKPVPCYLDELEPFGVRGGEKRWRNSRGDRIYTWDDLHGEIEVFNSRGMHPGAADAITGKMVKPAVKGRRIDV